MLIIAVTTPFLDRAVTNIIVLRHDLVPSAYDAGAARLGIPPESFSTAAIFSSLVLLSVSLWTLLLGVALLRRRAWAREAAILTFVFFTLCLPLSIVGVLSSPPAPNAWFGIGVGLIDATIVALLALRLTAEDVERADAQRRDRRHRTAGPRIAR